MPRATIAFPNKPSKLMNSRDEDRNLICRFVSWYHMLGILAYIESLALKPRRIVFCPGTFFEASAEVPREFLESLADEVDFADSPISAIKKLREDINCESCTLLTYNAHPIKPITYALFHHMHLRVVVVEEGIGSYGGFRQAVLAYSREHTALRKLPRSIALTLASIPIFGIRILTRFTGLSRRYLFNGPNFSDIDKYVRETYINALGTLASISHGNRFRLPNRTVLFVSSPFSEIGLMSANEQRQLTSEFESALQPGANFFIKPHPIEKMEKYEGWNTIDPAIPLEVLLHFNLDKIEDIYFFSSTGIYTCAILFKLQPYRIDRNDRFYRTLSSSQKKIIDRFSRPTSSVALLHENNEPRHNVKPPYQSPRRNLQRRQDDGLSK